jgi:hypothetical protein
MIMKRKKSRNPRRNWVKSLEGAPPPAATEEFIGAIRKRARAVRQREDGPLVTALQRRGFLVFRHRGQILLHRASHDEDERILRDWGLTVGPLEDPNWRARLGTENADVEKRVLTAVANFAPQNCGGLAGTVKPPVPARNLEPGIALFVKVLQIVKTCPACGAGIRTHMCCQGHEHAVHPQADCPTIWFWSKADKRQARAFLLLAAQEHPHEFHPLEFRYSPDAANDGSYTHSVEIHRALHAPNRKTERPTVAEPSAQEQAPWPSGDDFFGQIRTAAVAMLESVAMG